jgi:integrase
MAIKRIPGLIKRGQTWHVDKHIRGYGRVCCSTGTSDHAEAETILNKMVEQVRHVMIHGVRPPWTFRQAAEKYCEETKKKSIDRDAQDLRCIDPFIGDMLLKDVHNGSVAKFVEARLAEGTAAGTINRTLRIVRLVLKCAADLWRDDFGLSWLERPPKINMLSDKNKRQPYPLSHNEYLLLSAWLPAHLRNLARFGVNTGCREKEMTNLRWEWEQVIPEIGASVFVIPAEFVKNAALKLVVLNRHARKAIERCRGKHPEFVFTYPATVRALDGTSRIEHRPITKVYNSAWKRARKDLAKAYKRRFGVPCPDGLASIRVHDIRHTFGQRLRAVGVSLEDRQDLLGHKSGRITTHYCAAEIRTLIDACERVCNLGSRKSPAISVLRIKDRARIQHNLLKTKENIGGDGRNRTADLSIMSAAL